MAVRENTTAINDTINSHRRKSAGRSTELKEVANLLQLPVFKLASWNLQGGLRDGYSFECVARDMSKRQVSIGCLQETHNHDGAHKDCKGGRVVCLEESKTDQQCRYGLGFFIGESLTDRILDYRLISNRIAVLRLHNTPRGVSGPRCKPTTVCIVNVYAPTSQRAVKHPAEYRRFYEQLETTVRELRRKSVAVFVAGDFNSKLGLRRQTESGENESFMGQFGKGTRNRNGGYLATFLETHKLYAANTHFVHPMRHRTSWHGQIRDTVADKKLQIYNQIDYVCVPQRLKRSLLDGRSYSGNTFSSDHSMVVVQIKLAGVYSNRKAAAPLEKARERNSTAAAVTPCQDLRLSALVGKWKQEPPPAQVAFQENLKQRSLTSEGAANLLTEGVLQAAAEVLPQREARLNCQIDYLEDGKIRRWSQERRVLLSEWQSVKNGQDEQERVKALKGRRAEITLMIRKRCKKLREAAILEVAGELECTPQAQRRYAAVRVLKKKHAYKQFRLKDEDGYISTATRRLTKVVEDFYDKFFNPEGANKQPTVDPWGEYEGPLPQPLTVIEMSEAFHTLRNGRAVGPDGIPGELLRYGGTAVAKAAAQAVSNMFVTSTLLPQLGEGLLIPLNKPGKAEVPEHTRPITLLNSLRKGTSMAILNRISDTVDRYLSRAQCGFRRKRSTMDVAWMYSWLRAVGHRYDRSLHVYGIDMSKAFDSIERSKLLWILKQQVSLEETELRLIRALLSKTTLRVKLRGKLGRIFKTLLGIPQGDALSPILFVIYLEAAMREVRALDSELYMFGGQYVGRDWYRELMEAAYADDVDLLCVDRDRLQRRLEVLKSTFKRYNLTVNEQKTERITLDRDLHVDTKYRKLGTHVDAAEDLRRRLTSANNAFHTLWKVWLSRKISPYVRLRVYDACVKSILMYNIGTIAYTASQLNKLDAAHRRHLRLLLNIFYPKVIKTPTLYSRAHARPLREDIVIARWRCFKTALVQDLRDERNPTATAMRLYFHSHFDLPVPKRGAPPTTLPTLLHRDLKLVGRKLVTPADYKSLREMVQKAHEQESKEWQRMVELMAKLTTQKVLAPVELRRSTRKRKLSAVAREAMAQREPEETHKRRKLHVRCRMDPGLNQATAAIATNPDNEARETAAELVTNRADILGNARKRKLILDTIPEERPTRRRLKRDRVIDEGTDASTARTQRLDERLNVNNGVVSGRTF